MSTTTDPTFAARLLERLGLAKHDAFQRSHALQEHAHRLASDQAVLEKDEQALRDLIAEKQAMGAQLNGEVAKAAGIRTQLDAIAVARAGVDEALQTARAEASQLTLDQAVDQVERLRDEREARFVTAMATILRELDQLAAAGFVGIQGRQDLIRILGELRPPVALPNYVDEDLAEALGDADPEEVGRQLKVPAVMLGRRRFDGIARPLIEDIHRTGKMPKLSAATKMVRDARAAAADAEVRRADEAHEANRAAAASRRAIATSKAYGRPLTWDEALALFKGMGASPAEVTGLEAVAAVAVANAQVDPISEAHLVCPDTSKARQAKRDADLWRRRHIPTSGTWDEPLPQLAQRGPGCIRERKGFDL